MENIFTNIKDRVVEIAEKQSITKEEFFNSIGMTSASFRGKAKNSPLNSNAIVNIITKYPDTDLYWLILGSDSKEPKLEGRVEESGEVYHTKSESCKEKDRLIKILKNQIEDLKKDKEDLKQLLGLRNQ